MPWLQLLRAQHVARVGLHLGGDLVLRHEARVEPDDVQLVDASLGEPPGDPGGEVADVDLLAVAVAVGAGLVAPEPRPPGAVVPHDKHVLLGGVRFDCAPDEGRDEALVNHAHLAKVCDLVELPVCAHEHVLGAGPVFPLREPGLVNGVVAPQAPAVHKRHQVGGSCRIRALEGVHHLREVLHAEAFEVVVRNHVDHHRPLLEVSLCEHPLLGPTPKAPLGCGHGVDLHGRLSSVSGGTWERGRLEEGGLAGLGGLRQAPALRAA
mmetsp:Transcript_33323/g.106346  ORF Transcript_33323/g.106346 Transcript_33323/m.106346 type:complete len:265 (+) Transcript_33323:1617-2411(+)